MGKTNYRFNYRSLQFEEVKITIKTRLIKALQVVLAGMVFTTIVVAIAYTFFDSPKEKMQKREIAQYELQLSVFNERLQTIDKVLDNMQERDDNIYRVIFEAEPIPDAVREAGYGGSDRYSILDGYRNSEIIIGAAKKLDLLTSRMVIQSKSFDDVFEMATNKHDMLTHIPAIQPIDNKDLTRIASGFGYRIHPILKRRKFHEGIDFTAPTGTNIYATGAGVVVEAKRSRGGYGLMIVIDHGYGYTTLYAHLSKFEVRVGQKVIRGQIIGKVGNTGLSSGPHLHYEVHKANKKVNPVYYFYNDLTPEEYEKVIELASRYNQALS
ncbi:MAG: M23 family metallopeptidase [Bacteroidales bacterium]|nr:M23 family metallopeptidase [Bacteroidales bacterium]